MCVSTGSESTTMDSRCAVLLASSSLGLTLSTTGALLAVGRGLVAALSVRAVVVGASQSNPPSAWISGVHDEGIYTRFISVAAGGVRSR